MTIKNLYPTSRPTLNLDFANTKALDPRITFTRASTATYVDDDGLIKSGATNAARFDHNPTTGESLGLLVEEARTNLLLDSSLSTGNWQLTNVTRLPNSILSPDGTFTAVKISSTTGTWQTFLAQQSVAGITATPHTFSVYAKAGEASWIALAGIQFGEAIAYFNLSTGTLGTRSAGSAHTITPVGNGWYRCTVSCASASSTQWGFFPASADNTLTPAPIGQGIYIWGAQLETGSFPTSYIPTPATFTSRASTATYYDSAGVIQTAGSNVARSAAFFPDSSGVMRPAGLLLEAAGTNLALNSENATGNTNQTSGTSTVTVNTTVAPDGNTTADTVAFSSDILNGRFQTSFSSTSGVVYTLSFWVKAISGSTAFSMWDSNSSTIQAFTATSAWQRLSLTFTAASTSASYFVRPIQATNSVASSFAVWGVQVETGSYPTSYIPTVASTVTRSADVSSSATVTRAADVASITGTNFSSWYNQSEGTLLAEQRTQAGQDNLNTTTFVLSSANVNTEYIGMRISNDYNRADIYGNGASAALTPYASVSAGVLSRNALAYALNNAAAVRNGGTVATDSSVGLPIPFVDRCSIGYNSGYGYQTRQHISRLTYYPVRLPDATLQALTAS